MENSQVKVGVGVLIFKNNKILMAKRKNAHGEGEYATPGGKLEYMESFEDCAKRETLEECGLKIKNVRFLYLMNLKKYAPKHFVHIELIADWDSGEAKNVEPDKSEDWEWFDIESLPTPCFETVTYAAKALKSGENYYDL